MSSTKTTEPPPPAAPDNPAADLDAARTEIAEAEAEAAEAIRLIEALEQAVRDGAESVNPEDLDRGYGLKRLAILRKEAAEGRAKRARGALAEQRRAAVLRDAEEQLTALSLERLADLHNAARDALLALAEAAVRRRELITDTARELAALDTRRRGPAQPSNPESVTVGGVTYRHQDAPVRILLPRLLAAVAKGASGAHYAGMPDLNMALYQWTSGSPCPVEQMAAQRRAATEAAA